MTIRSAHAGSVARPAQAALTGPLATWLDRLGVAPAANDPAGPCVRVVIERGPRLERAYSRRTGPCTTTLVAGSRLDVIA